MRETDATCPREGLRPQHCFINTTVSSPAERTQAIVEEVVCLIIRLAAPDPWGYLI